ncbi:MAG: hypothetical protein WEB37_06125 [Bacteroidota bacterium]
MKPSRSKMKTYETRPIMVWSITDEVIEDRSILEKQFRDLVDAGFGGVAAFVRCSRYSWNDPMAVDAWRHINKLCRKTGMQCWLGPDPRFVSHEIARDGSGLEILLFGDTAKATIVPNIAELRGGRFNIRCTVPPRHVHTLTDVAILFFPVGLARVYAIRSGKTRLGKNDVIDITGHAHHFYNARDGYVEAFGSVPKPIGDGWSVASFFRVRTNHLDFSNPRHLRTYDALLRGLKEAGCSPDGIMWDEPGYTCQYGSLPYSRVIQSSYRAARKSSLESDLWKLAFEAEDSSHIPVRIGYYRSVQDSITRAELGLRKTVHRLWGRATVLGIHDTWHFESADMCDMNHGSLNLWESARAKDGGFVDLGAVNKLTDPDSPWYSNLAAMSVIAASLGKTAQRPLAFNNLWTVGDNDKQTSAMEHCVKVMALFGTRWLAHAYGPVGTIGQERTFLGTPELPGYPRHSTWPSFPSWNRFLSTELKKIDNALPKANLLLVYPVESLYALADSRADKAAEMIFRLLLTLLDNHIHVDVLATTDLRKARWNGKTFRVGPRSYDFVLCPHAAIMDRALVQTLNAVKERVLFLSDAPKRFSDGKPQRASLDMISMEPDEVLALIRSRPELRPVEAPEQTWVTITVAKNGTIVSLIPSRAGARYKGTVKMGSRSIAIPETDQLRRILFPPSGEPIFL